LIEVIYSLLRDSCISHELLRFRAALVMQRSMMHRLASPCLSLPFFTHWLNSRSPPQTQWRLVFEGHAPSIGLLLAISSSTSSLS